MDPTLVRWLKQEVVIEPFQDKLNPRGGKDYGSAFTINGHIVGEIRMIRTDSGEEKVSHETIYTNGTPEALSITQKDRLTMPDDSQPPILAIRYHRNELGRIETVEINI